jgi:alpha-galactosidase
MNQLIYNKEKLEFRYISDMTVYSEKLVDGRLICTDYHAGGMPQHSLSRIADNPITAFELEIDGKDATFGWELLNWEEKREENGRVFSEMILKNYDLKIEMKIITYCGDNGFFSRKIYILNTSENDIGITRVSPLCGVLWEQNENVREFLQDGNAIPYSIGGYMDKWWGMEGNFDWRDIPFNTVVEFGSDTGRSGHNHPFAIAKNNIMGGYFICQLEWSGNWMFRFTNDFHNHGSEETYIRLCFSAGPTAKAPMRVVSAGEKIEIPSVHFGYTYNDFDGAIQDLHNYQRKYLLAKSPLGYEPISYTHWGYERWDIKEDIVLKQVERASELGFEMFVVDAGWYGKPGSHWKDTVGDWQYSRLPNDLYKIVERTHELGMLFGLWIEPEAIGDESVALKEHPDWLINRYGHGVERCLDISRPEIEEYVENQIINLIERYDIDMLRLDYNNNFLYEGGFNKHNEYWENTHWRHVEAIHRIFDRIRAKYPKIILENCASGGGRTDIGMMKRFSKTQISDWYKFPRVARTFNGMSICLPPEKILMLYGPGMTIHRYGNAELQLQMTVQGAVNVTGVAPADEPINQALVSRMKEYIKIYKEFIRPIQLNCRIYHHTPVIKGFEGNGWAVWENTTQDGTKGYATFVRLPNTDKDVWIFKPRGLDISKEYTITLVSSAEKFTAKGLDLYTNGLSIRLDGALTSQMILFEEKN